jgi:hypothetical protein
MADVEARGAVNNYPTTLIAKNGDTIEVSLSLSQLKNRDGVVLGTVGISRGYPLYQKCPQWAQGRFLHVGCGAQAERSGFGGRGMGECAKGN